LLYYGNFEQWQENLPQGWTFIEPDAGVTTACDSQTVYSGRYACNCIFTTQEQAQTDFVHDIIPVTPGQSYTLSSRIFDNDPAGRTRFVIYWYDADSSLIIRQYVGSYSKDETDWQVISKETVADQQASYAAVGFRFYDLSDAWDGDCEIIIDSVAVVLTPTQPPQMNNLSPRYFQADTQLVIRIQVMDDIGVDRVQVSYYLNGDSSLITTIDLDSIDQDIWQAAIPPQPAATPLCYYLQLTDKDTIKHTMTSELYKTVVGSCPIQFAKMVDDQGCMYYIGYSVCLSGVVTSASGTFSQGVHNEFIQDRSGGINIYSGLDIGIMQSLSLHDSIKVWGQLYQYAGCGEIFPDSIVILKTSAHRIMPIHLIHPAIDEDYEGCLVQVNSGQLTDWVVQEDSSFYAVLETAAGMFTLYINRFTDIDGMVNPGIIDSLVGIVSQYDGELPYTDGYFILPRSRDDIYYTMVTAASGESNRSPKTMQLFDNFPNPFNAVTMIGYQLPAIAEVELVVYNLLGQRIQTLVSERQAAGQYQVAFNACNLPSGIYFYKITSDLGSEKIRKMILCK
jgi:hypothetical protein